MITSCIRSVACLFLVAVPVAIEAQAAATERNTFFQAAGSMFALSVSDIDASTTWYSEKLGLRVKTRIPRNDQTRAAVVILEGGGLTVELIKHDDAASPQSQANPMRNVLTHGIAKVGFEVLHFDAVMDSLRARGVRFALGPFPKRSDQPANVILHDNAGNMIQMIGR